jgi:hypothetical protein
MDTNEHQAGVVGDDVWWERIRMKIKIRMRIFWGFRCFFWGGGGGFRVGELWM